MKHLFLMKDIKKHHEFARLIPHIMTNYDYDIIYLQSVAQMKKTVLNLKTPHRLYIVGGDGTLHDLIQVTVFTKHEIVVVPLGTGNDFNRCISSTQNPYQVIKESLKQQAQLVDTILVNDQYYINSACFGVDSVIANHVHDTKHSSLIPESQSYLASITKHLFKYPYYTIELYSHDQCLYKGPVTLCTLNNGQYYGGGFMITPQAKINDGLIDICVVDKIPHIKIPYLFSLLLAKKIAHRKEVHYFKVKEAKLISKHSSNLDGEYYKDNEYHFKIQPQSINIVYKKP